MEPTLFSKRDAQAQIPGAAAGLSTALVAAKTEHEVGEVLFAALSRQVPMNQLCAALWERATVLAKDAPAVEFGPDGTMVHHGIFHHSTLCRSSLAGVDLLPNDPNIFAEQTLGKAIAGAWAQATPADGSALSKLLPLVAVRAVREYFGSAVPEESKDLDRVTLLLKHHPLASVAVLRNMPFARSEERVPVFTQIMAAFGFDVSTVSGEVAREDGPFKKHSFCVVRPVDSGARLFEITFPVVTAASVDVRAKRIGSFPLDAQTLAGFRAGAEFEVTSPGVVPGEAKVRLCYRWPAAKYQAE